MQILEITKTLYYKSYLQNNSKIWFIIVYLKYLHFLDLTCFRMMKSLSTWAQYDLITRVLSSLATRLHSNQPAVFSQQPMWPLPLQSSFASQLICLFCIFPSFLGAPPSECIGPTGAAPNTDFAVLALLIWSLIFSATDNNPNIKKLPTFNANQIWCNT